MKRSSSSRLSRSSWLVKEVQRFWPVGGRYELPFDSRIPTVVQDMAILEVMDEAESEGEVHRGVLGGGGAVD
jgi:hypothetical protein